MHGGHGAPAGRSAIGVHGGHRGHGAPAGSSAIAVHGGVTGSFRESVLSSHLLSRLLWFLSC